MKGSLRPLAGPAFRVLWFGRTVSLVGDGLTPVAFVLAVISGGGSAGDVGIVLASGTGARLLLLLVGGVWSDRISRKQILVWTQLLQATFFGILGLAVLDRHAGLLLFVLTRVMAGAANAFFLPASSAAVPDMVDARELQSANALLSLSRSVTSVVGPAAAGIVIAASNAGVIFLANSASFLVSALFLTRLPGSAAKLIAKRSFLADLARGWQATVGRRWYIYNIVAHGFWNLGISFFFVLGPVVATRELGGPASWGIISSGVALGSLAGGLVALRVRLHRPLVFGNFGLVLAVAPMLALAIRSPVVVIALCATGGFAASSLMNQLWFAVVQQLFDREVLARVSSYDAAISLLATPVGYAVAGPIAAVIGIESTLVAAATLLAAPCIAVVSLPGVWRVRRLPDGNIVEMARQV